MPIYEYQCTACDHRFEAEQRITENPLDTCPKCNEKKVRRLISATAFHLKGSGWYKTDYGSSSNGSSSSAGSSSTTSSSANGSEKASTDSPTSDGAAKDTAKPSSEKQSSAAADTAKSADTKAA